MLSIDMDHLPVEVIGNILSHLKAARDIVIASTTCRKWRHAWRSNLQSLSFNYHEWPGYRDLANADLEILITETIFQTVGLQDLYIYMDDTQEFSVASVIAWLMYTRETLRKFHYNVRTSTRFNIIEKCVRHHKLEELVLAYNSISGVEPSYQKFPCLRLLVLSYVSVSALDLGLLLTVCPKIETFMLVSPDISMSDAQATMELSSSSLKHIYLDGVRLDKFTLEAGSLEKLHLKDCTLELFELIGKGSLRVLKIDDVNLLYFDIGESTANLEVVDVSNFTITGPKFCNMISRSAKLTRLKLWGVVFEDQVVDWETMPVCFPHLTHLSLNYDLRDNALCDLRGDDVLRGSLNVSHQFNNVVVLELGWTVINDLFTEWVAVLLARCPNLRRLVIHGVVSEAETHYECQILANFTSTIVRLMRKYMNVEVQFEYE
ncbi:F-box/LRR-repeat protein At1g67190-like [Euphorbia lathyris]|uniref:F-box/LRR-repeat protein At1g67190-like n=1 Tax=Euphorbia lathyris TaxID=212925 RepID=UPI003313CCF0